MVNSAEEESAGKPAPVSGVELLAREATRLRISALEQILGAGFGHLGSSFSCAELVAGAFQVFDFARTGHAGIDRFILSKGHAAPMLYAATRPHSEPIPYAISGSGSPGHPNAEVDHCTVVSSGSVGIGPAIGMGLAIGLVLKRLPGRVVVLVGDGELQAGMVWEAVQNVARRPELPLLLLVDANGYQGGMLVRTNDITKRMLEVAAPVFRSISGNDTSQVLEVMQEFAAQPRSTVVWADTVRGAGADIAERNPLPMTWRPSAKDAESMRQQLELNLRCRVTP